VREKKKRRQRQEIFDLEDEIAQRWDNLIAALEHRMTQKTFRTTFYNKLKKPAICITLF